MTRQDAMEMPPDDLPGLMRALVRTKGWERPESLCRLDLTAPDVAGHLLAQLAETGRFYLLVRQITSPVYTVQCRGWPAELPYPSHEHLGAAVAQALIVVLLTPA